MNVEVMERPASEFGPTTLPQELVEHFAAEGKQLRLVHAGSGNLGFQRGYGRHVVLVEDLPEKLQRVVKTSGFDNPKKHDGEIRVGDCILVSVSNETLAFWEGEYRRRYEATANSHDFLENVNQAVDRANFDIKSAGGAAQVKVAPLNDNKLSDHVHGGRDLAEEILAAQARRK